MGRKLGAPKGHDYARWMRDVLGNLTPEVGAMQNALRAISASKIPIATLNYDTLVEKSVGLQAIDFVDIDSVMRWTRKEVEGVLHLHGVWTNPANCVFGIRDYHSALSDETRSQVQRSLSSLNRLLFIGCGDTFIDPNFSALVSWLRQNLGASSLKHYALVRNKEVTTKLADPAWRGFVEPLAYGEEYADLSAFLLNHFPTRRSSNARVSRQKSVEGQSIQTIDAYRQFLLRDCGEMTIEGMRADMDTAQRKFDLEKLFVPLEVNYFPPAIPLNDPDRKAKLAEWHNENADPVAFASAFKENHRIALLALPGGGKTLLLKRLAVAYSHPPRRASSADNLPALDLLPVMIRCREWKEHIRKPLPTLLKSMAEITGETKLEGLAEALEKRLKAGTVILLVDGLDEIHDDGDRSVFVENLEKFLESYTKIRFVVTSREAGFDLVAPCLNRFCAKLKIAPLNRKAIEDLCDYWHQLMSAGTPDSVSEGKLVAKVLLEGESLRRLAENPLLLTMLLVVKHGAGRLPPDRVSLYNRAVEVLLDTWNTKGHDALNVKEALPQLACLAFELLRQGKQTATEREILEILNRARIELPMLGRYAKDSPHEFLKRVELRSSLMLEGGHTSESGSTVPFYQFRHLTFQEYLSAVAAVEGHTLSNKRGSLLSAFAENLVSDEWKEVIPMAAVLARTQAEPLLEALVALAELEKGRYLQEHADEHQGFPEYRLPPATGRLAQSMAEEAIFDAVTLAKAVNQVAFFARGCRSNDNWQAISRGPYGPDLRQAALDLFIGLERQPDVALTRNTVALLEAHNEIAGFWTGSDCETELLTRLSFRGRDETRAILSICGAFWQFRERAAPARSQRIYIVFEQAMWSNNPSTQRAAVWAWGFWRH